MDSETERLIEDVKRKTAALQAETKRLEAKVETFKQGLEDYRTIKQFQKQLVRCANVD